MGDETPTKVCRNPLDQRRIFVVNRNHPNLFRTMWEYFYDRSDISVILDRREGEREMGSRIVEGFF